jgi:hypothetical protein
MLDRIFNLNLGNTGIIHLLGEGIFGKSKKWLEKLKEASKTGKW